MAQQVAEVISSGDVCQSHEVGGADSVGANESSVSLNKFQPVFARRLPVLGADIDRNCCEVADECTESE